jgi:uncharacterized protein involved in exopolysaccharide biosynthesis
VTIKATQLKESMIVTIVAAGAEPKFTREYLNCLLNELRDFFDAIKEQRRSKATTALANEVVKLEAEVKALKKQAGVKANQGPDGKLVAVDAAEVQRLKDAAEAKDRIYRMKFDAVRELQKLEDAQPDNFTIMERATGAVQDVQQNWKLQLAAPVVLGFLGGVVLMLLVAAIGANRLAARAP